MATVKLIDVCKIHEQQKVLENINLTIEQGEFIVIIGPSGCGKSSLLRLIAGLDHLSSGQILLNNECVNALSAAKRNIAMVFQNYALYPHMTVFNNMAYGLKIRGLTSREIETKVHHTADMLHLTDYLHRKPYTLSGGQKQRVAMGRAIVRSPAAFLFDEPLSNLDTKLRNEMRHEIRKIHQQLGTTCIYVTHDQTEAMTMASRLVVLNAGKIEQIGTPRELYQQPNSLFVASFTGHFPMNLIPAKVVSPQKISLLDSLEVLIPDQMRVEHQQPLYIGVRPEHLRLVSKTTANSLRLNLDFIDDMGADKLLHTKTRCGRLRLIIRALSDEIIPLEDLAVEIDYSKVNIFDQRTGLRLGGWHGST